jgi:hypothetical protein
MARKTKKGLERLEAEGAEVTASVHTDAMSLLDHLKQPGQLQHSGPFPSSLEVVF